MRELNLDQLRTLVAIADLGTFSAACRALHLAQPTVSLHVSELEARLDTPLLLRGHRRVTPTAAGADLVSRARRLLREADDAERRAGFAAFATGTAASSGFGPFLAGQLMSHADATATFGVLSAVSIAALDRKSVV